eukprot:3780522-Pyramimonas_sp.AAC.1
MPAALHAVVARGNEFINKPKEASDNDVAMAKAKAKHKSNPCKGPAAAEPKCGSYEEASAAAQLCTKCIPCKYGSKGR